MGGLVGSGLLCAFIAFRAVRMFRGRSDARRAVDKGHFGPRITEVRSVLDRPYPVH